MLQIPQEMEKSVENSQENILPGKLKSVPICYRAEYQKALAAGNANNFLELHQTHSPVSPKSNGTPIPEETKSTKSTRQKVKSRSIYRSHESRDRRKYSSDRSTRRKEPYYRSDRRSKYYREKEKDSKNHDIDILQDLQMNLQSVGSYLIDIAETLSTYM